MPSATFLSNDVTMLKSGAVASPRPLSPVDVLSDDAHDAMTDEERPYGSDGASSGSPSTGTISMPKTRRRRSARPKATYHLAHPPPNHLKQKKLLHIRPKLFLQLQRLSIDARPMPTFDVVPMNSSHLSRMAKKFTGRKVELGSHSVVVVTSEDYEGDGDDERHTGRDMIATMAPLKKDDVVGKTEICMVDGSIWEATPLANGNYQFVMEGDGGKKLCARWVRRSTSPERDPESGMPQYKHNFSIVDPNSRRHPVIATLTGGTLEIPDSFSTLASAEGSPNGKGGRERTNHRIEGTLRLLIQVTGIWVALREGVSPYYQLSDPSCSTPSPGLNSPRTLSFPSPDPSRTGDSQSPVDGSSVSGKLQHLLHRSPARSASPRFERSSSQRSVSANNITLNSKRRSNSNANGDFGMSDGELSSPASSRPPSVILPRRSVTLSSASTRRYSLPPAGQSAKVPERQRPISSGGPASPHPAWDTVPEEREEQDQGHDKASIETPQAIPLHHAAAVAAAEMSQPTKQPRVKATAERSSKWHPFRRCLRRREGRA